MILTVFAHAIAILYTQAYVRVTAALTADATADVADLQSTRTADAITAAMIPRRTSRGESSWLSKKPLVTF